MLCVYFYWIHVHGTPRDRSPEDGTGPQENVDQTDRHGSLNLKNIWHQLYIIQYWIPQKCLYIFFYEGEDLEDLNSFPVIQK